MDKLLRFLSNVVSARLKVLAIEDDEGVLGILSHVLRRAGFEVVEAGSGGAGLALARMGTFDVITLDIDLPDMMGFEVCEQLKEDGRTRGIPVVFVSGRGCAESMARAFEVGGVEFIQKPFDVREFAGRLLRHVRKNSVEAESGIAG